MQKQQGTLDNFVKRTFTLKTGEVVQLKRDHAPSAPKTKFVCDECGLECTKPGPLAVHKSLKHPTKVETPTNNPQQKHPGHFQKFDRAFPVPFWKRCVVLGAVWIASFLNPARTTFKRVLECDDDTQPTKKMKGDGRKSNKGSAMRKTYSYQFRARVMDQWFQALESDPKLTQENFCSELNLAQCSLSKWLNNRNFIFQAAAKSHVDKLAKTFPSRGAKFPLLENELIRLIRLRRDEGRKVSSVWMKVKGKKLMQDMFQEENISLVSSLKNG
jgi:hypothetical protein